MSWRRLKAVPAARSGRAIAVVARSPLLAAPALAQVTKEDVESARDRMVDVQGRLDEMVSLCR